MPTGPSVFISFQEGNHLPAVIFICDINNRLTVYSRLFTGLFNLAVTLSHIPSEKSVFYQTLTWPLLIAFAYVNPSPCSFNCAVRSFLSFLNIITSTVGADRLSRTPPPFAPAPQLGVLNESKAHDVTALVDERYCTVCAVIKPDCFKILLSVAAK